MHICLKFDFQCSGKHCRALVIFSKLLGYIILKIFVRRLINALHDRSLLTIINHYKHVYTVTSIFNEHQREERTKMRVFHRQTVK